MQHSFGVPEQWTSGFVPLTCSHCSGNVRLTPVPAHTPPPPPSPDLPYTSSTPPPPTTATTTTMPREADAGEANVVDMAIGCCSLRDPKFHETLQPRNEGVAPSLPYISVMVATFVIRDTHKKVRKTHARDDHPAILRGTSRGRSAVTQPGRQQVVRRAGAAQHLASWLQQGTVREHPGTAQHPPIVLICVFQLRRSLSTGGKDT